MMLWNGGLGQKVHRKKEAWKLMMEPKFKTADLFAGVGGIILHFEDVDSIIFVNDFENTTIRPTTLIGETLSKLEELGFVGVFKAGKGMYGKLEKKMGYMRI